MEELSYFQQQVKEKYGGDEDLHTEAIKVFSFEKYISTASIQRHMKVSYMRAAVLLDRLVDEGFASPRIGASPCRVLKGRFKKLKSHKAVIITRAKRFVYRWTHLF